MRISEVRFATAIFVLGTTLFVEPALADDTVEIRLPLGTVQMTKTSASRDLVLSTDTEKLLFESAYFPEVEAFSGNSFLIFLASGEHKCAGFYIWTTLDDAGLRASPQFGSCSGRGKVLRTPKGLMLAMPGPGESNAVSFILEKDGTVTENDQGLEASGIVDLF